MTTLDTDLGFEEVLRRATRILEATTGTMAEKPVEPAPVEQQTGRWTAVALFAALAIAGAVTVVTGYQALVSDTPGIWIHRLMAVILVQIVLAAAAVAKIGPALGNGGGSVRIAAGAARMSPPPMPSRSEPDFPGSEIFARKPPIAGTLAGREYLRNADGTIEIDTLVGRRRFVSLDAAKEFVGG